MSKIVRVVNDIVFIGLGSGQVKEVRRSDCDFEPLVGLEVEVYESETTTIVHKVHKEEVIPSDKGINIKIENNNTTSGIPTYIMAGKVVNKTVYLVLCFFLGGIGAHKFYAGKISSGIMYIIFCWTFIPVFISLIEFIGTLFKKADLNGNIIV